MAWFRVNTLLSPSSKCETGMPAYVRDLKATGTLLSL